MPGVWTCLCLLQVKTGKEESFCFFFLDVFDLFAIEFISFRKPWHWFLSDSWNYHLTALYDNTVTSEHVCLTLSNAEEFCWSRVAWLCTLRIQMYIRSWVLLLATAVFLQSEYVCRLLCLSLSFVMEKSGFLYVLGDGYWTCGYDCMICIFPSSGYWACGYDHKICIFTVLNLAWAATSHQLSHINCFLQFCTWELVVMKYWNVLQLFALASSISLSSYCESATFDVLCLHVFLSFVPFMQNNVLPWYNLAGWLGIKHQVT